MTDTKQAANPHGYVDVAHVTDETADTGESADRPATCAICDRTFAMGENGSGPITCPACVAQREATA